MDSIELNPELTRAALPQAVLAVLSHGENHGYVIAELLRSHGFTRIKGGTLYPLLKRLEDQGLLEHAWEHDESGPGRKLFTLTKGGQDELERLQQAWLQMSQALSQIHTTRQDKP